jgi:hypothetical protein
MTTAIEEGSNVGKTWRLTTGNPIVLGTTALTFVDSSGGGGGVAGANRNIQYNDSGSSGGASDFLYYSANGNVVIGSTTSSTSDSTGALVVKGGAAVAGNVYTNAIRTTTGIYWAGNGNPIAGITYTASSSPPSGPTKGDQWYDTDTDILYEYVFDGTSSYWVDIQTIPLAADSTISVGASSYSNSNVAAYLPTDSTITTIQANIGAFQIYSNANASTQSVSITSLATNANANTAAYFLANPLAISSGGTGASTVAGAQTALEVDPAGTAVALAIALG